jgi:hypothetical protein
MNFAEQYQQAFANLGRSLRRGDGIPKKKLLATEKNLGLRLPNALLEYYRVAGRAKDFNCAHDQLISPNDWGNREPPTGFHARKSSSGPVRLFDYFRARRRSASLHGD